MSREESESEALMVPPFRHFLLTRFSVAIFGSRFCDRTWLDRRFELFEKYCFPSVQAQSNQSFEWLVFFDSSLPEDLRARVTTYAQFPPFRPIYVKGVRRNSLREVMQGLAISSEYIITSRLDNDDALAIGYIEAVQKCFAKQKFEFINIPNGYIWDGSRAYSVRHTSNGFVSLIERTDRCKTALKFDHRKVAKHGRLLQVENMPGWVLVVHGDNVANSVQGTPVLDTEWKRHFGVSALRGNS